MPSLKVKMGDDIDEILEFNPLFFEETWLEQLELILIAVCDRFQAV